MMRVIETHHSRKIHRLVAFALALWLGGVGCLLGCEMNVSAAILTKTVAEEQTLSPKTSCPAFSGLDCCHHAKSDGEQASAQNVPQPADAMSC